MSQEKCSWCVAQEHHVWERESDIRRALGVLERSPGTPQAKSAKTNIAKAKAAIAVTKKLLEEHDCVNYKPLKNPSKR